MKIKYYSGSDSRNRCKFSLHWEAAYHPGDPKGEHREAERSQHYFADPRKYGFTLLTQEGFMEYRLKEIRAKIERMKCSL